MTVPLLVGTDGVKKMSKSYGNYIGINDAPKDIFGKVMSISDELMMQYYELLTAEDLAAVKAMHPMTAKKNLAKILTSRFHGAEAGQKELENFEQVFSKKELPTDLPTLNANGQTYVSIILAANFAKSKNEARRLIMQGGVKLNGEKVLEEGPVNFDGEAVLQVGKKNFIKLVK